ncbi:hypothetical protein C8J56DRAFT_778468 [Mycena floridula]|nr:hypothetical protein C8J56DRAFT_778468 [Mycena floridula]
MLVQYFLLCSFLLFTIAVPIPASGEAKKATSKSSLSSKSSPSSGSTKSSKSSLSTSSGSSKAPTSGGTSRGKAGSLAFLFPVKTSARWTTFAGGPDAVPLQDATFRMHHQSGPKGTYTQVPDGSTALKANFPKGSYKPSASPRGGLSFYALGPAKYDLTQAKEATFGYSVMFPSGFDPNKGGKLPGFYGGDSENAAVSCSGGRRDSACFSTRLMWRPKNAGELYTYLPPTFAANKKVCSVPNSECNPTYGASVGRGSFTFEAGKWITVSQRVRLNDPGKENGELELFVQGKSVIKVAGLVFRKGKEGRIRGIQIQTFFGGSTVAWASPKNQDIFMKDFSVGIVSKL